MAVVAAAALLLVAVWFRCRALDHLPGINGDEAWYGVKAMELLRGEPTGWQTPTGNPLNPFFILPLVLLHLVFHPSAALLRSVAAASGVAALGVNWYLCRRVFDGRTAAISTLALAVLPINIAYSRFAWDAGQSLLATLPVLYCSLGAVRFRERQDRWLAAAVAAQLAAVLVHPTNIFAGAAIAVAVVGMALRKGDGAHFPSRSSSLPSPATENAPRPRLSRRAVATVGLGALALAIWAVNLGKTPGPAHVAGRLGHLCELVQPGDLPHFTVLYARLFSGATVYEFIPGSRSWLQRPGIGLDVLLCWALLLAAAWRLWRGASGEGDSPIFVPTLRVEARKSGQSPDTRLADRLLVITSFLELAAFLVLAGPQAMAPGQERFAICLIAPAVVLVARGIAVCPTLRPVVVAAALAAGTFLLADFQQHYFRFFQRTGGQAHATFRTGPVEPKQAALEYILARRRPGVTWIVASQWWNYWPLRYLGMDQADLRVVKAEEAAAMAELSAAAAEGRVWCVEFTGSEGLDQAKAAMAGGAAREIQTCDYAGRPVISVLAPVN